MKSSTENRTLLFRVDRNGVIRHAEKICTALTGYSTDEFIHKDLNQFIYPEEDHRLLPPINEPQSSELNIFIKNKDGKISPLSLIVVPDVEGENCIGYRIFEKKQSSTRRTDNSSNKVAPDTQDTKVLTAAVLERRLSILGAICAACLSISTGLALTGAWAENAISPNNLLWIQWITAGTGGLLALWLAMAVAIGKHSNEFPNSTLATQSYCDHASQMQNDTETFYAHHEKVSHHLENRLQQIKNLAMCAMISANREFHLHPSFQIISRKISDIMLHTTHATEELNILLAKKHEGGGNNYLTEVEALIIGLENALEQLTYAMASASLEIQKLTDTNLVHSVSHEIFRPTKIADNIVPIRPGVPIIDPAKS